MNSQIRHSASAVTEEGEPCWLHREELAEKRQVYLSPRICKEIISIAENKSQESRRLSLLSQAEIHCHCS